MYKLKTFLTVAITLIFTVSAAFAVTMSVDELKQLTNGDTGEAMIGAMSGPNVYNDMVFHRTIKFRDATAAVALLDTAAARTLTSSESGTTFLLSAVGTTFTLPAVANTGINYRFMINGASDTNNFVVDSAEGDNINGTLTVNNADVVCEDEDQINFVVDGEELGDTVSIMSDGSQWLIMGSDATTAAKITCTDPS